MIFSYLLNMQSHPSWVCGLKLKHTCNRFTTLKVTPFVGVWIETSLLPMIMRTCPSHPSWVCGLKQTLYLIMSVNLGHTLRGCVD